MPQPPRQQAVQLASNTLSITTTQGNLNYIVNQTITAENIKTQTDLNGLTSDNDQEEISYFDGLARPMQSIQHQGSPLKNDIITTGCLRWL